MPSIDQNRPITPLDSRWFYRELPILASFEQAANGQNHTELPDDWSIVICDVVGSTKAIEQGKYKNVNTVGAATIVSVLNVDRWIPIPFVFGGDGATLAIPKVMEPGVRQALLGAKELARDAFGLELRVGMIPVKEARRSGDRVALGRYSLGTGVFQSSLSGFGWDRAEKFLKDESTRSTYEVVETSECKPNADFSGFECRWRPIPAKSDHKLAILVQSLSKDPQDHIDTYTKVLFKLKSIYGDLQNAHPIDISRLVISLSPRQAVAEFKVQTQGLSFSKRITYGTKLALYLIIGRIVIGLGVKILGVDWSEYKRDVVRNSDFRKFDGTLKLVVDGSSEQRETLEAFLEDEYKNDRLVYGLHESRAAIVTCLVFSHGEQHSHFVDGSDGGYTIASKALKSQLASYQKARSKDSA